MSDKLDQILTVVQQTQTDFRELREDIKNVEIKNATQDEQIKTLQDGVVTNRNKIGAAFKKIEDHIAGHMVYYTGTIGIVIGILAIANYLK